ncbi:MAG: type II toxin-antitoxin system PemK/MazF family toxin [Oscillospiraceae bacterium]|nr:type II toxin-antitoxin system PemK/MazF family toxin [Oscillospiraceae bacterium]
MIFSQGDIIKFDFDPTFGHEQAGYRPSVVISRKTYNQRTGLIVVCPISSVSRQYPTWVPLDNSVATRGFVLCEHIRTIDVSERNPKFIEKIGEVVLERILAVVESIIQKDD